MVYIRRVDGVAIFDKGRTYALNMWGKGFCMDVSSEIQIDDVDSSTKGGQKMWKSLVVMNKLI